MYIFSVHYVSHLCLFVHNRCTADATTMTAQTDNKGTMFVFSSTRGSWKATVHGINNAAWQTHHGPNQPHKTFIL